MFERALKPTSKSLPAQRVSETAPAAPTRALDASALPRFGFASLAVHPPGQPPAPAQLSARPARPPRPNRTGLPDRLKSGVEALSGISLDGVKVHYNSPRPAQLDALAYARGREIHLAPGQDEHLPHETWHLVQQAQGRVRPTTESGGGVPINEDRGLEREADVMGARAVAGAVAGTAPAADLAPTANPPAQLQGDWWRRLIGGAGQIARRVVSTNAAPPQRAIQPLIPRHEVVTAGPRAGAFTSAPGTFFRALQHTLNIIRGVDTKGYQAKPVRDGKTIDRTDPTAEEITEYSGVEGKKSAFRESRVVGVNEDVLHTGDVAARTSGKKGLGEILSSKVDPNEALRVDEVAPGQNLKLHSVEEAFRQTNEKNRHPVRGEHVAVGEIPPANLGHTVVWPLDHPDQQEGLGQPGQVHPDYLRHIGRMFGEGEDGPAGASPTNPRRFAINTRHHDDPGNPGGKIEIDTLSEILKDEARKRKTNE